MIIRINNLKAETIIGAYPAERKAKRKVVLNLAIEYDATIAASTDKLEDALDYASIEKVITTTLPKQKFHLIESLASYVAHTVLAMERVRGVTVVLDKPGAIENADSVSVEYSLRK
ncbi:MAG: dihydroneopterin aldolase [Alphaproteobacteria bacterium]